MSYENRHARAANKKPLKSLPIGYPTVKPAYDQPMSRVARRKGSPIPPNFELSSSPIEYGSDEEIGGALQAKVAYQREYSPDSQDRILIEAAAIGVERPDQDMRLTHKEHKNARRKMARNEIPQRAELFRERTAVQQQRARHIAYEVKPMGRASRIYQEEKDHSRKQRDAMYEAERLYRDSSESRHHDSHHQYSHGHGEVWTPDRHRGSDGSRHGSHRQHSDDHGDVWTPDRHRGSDGSRHGSHRQHSDDQGDVWTPNPRC